MASWPAHGRYGSMPSAAHSNVGYYASFYLKSETYMLIFITALKPNKQIIKESEGKRFLEEVPFMVQYNRSHSHFQVYLGCVCIYSCRLYTPCPYPVINSIPSSTILVPTWKLNDAKQQIFSSSTFFLLLISYSPFIFIAGKHSIQLPLQWHSNRCNRAECKHKWDSITHYSCHRRMSYGIQVRNDK